MASGGGNDFSVWKRNRNRKKRVENGSGIGNSPEFSGIPSGFPNQDQNQSDTSQNIGITHERA